MTEKPNPTASEAIAFLRHNAITPTHDLATKTLRADTTEQEVITI
jgi:hypothetical protein